MSKPTPELAQRDAVIIEQRASGQYSLGDIAKMHGITPERARQIATAGGVDPDRANAAHAQFVAQREYEKAEKNAGAILMLFVAGKSYQEIAAATGCQVKSVREVLDEQITDEVLAARSQNTTSRIFPEAQRGPREQRPERADRHWTEKTVFDALVNFAKEQGGRLPSSTKYQQTAPTRDDLPSFATVRNRLGRWSDIRVEVHRAART